MSAHELHNLAVAFRTNSPNLGHVSVFDAMLSDAGLAYRYGLYVATPQRFRRKRRAMREMIAIELEQRATLGASSLRVHFEPRNDRYPVFSSVGGAK